jgi:hypothetical protein
MAQAVFEDGTHAGDAALQQALESKVCDFCGNTFNRREHLIRHRRTRKSAGTLTGLVR